ncbi:hypothetical protein PHYBLDRAFT_152137 [Phycomyces blakesleeanus NRRL 1555(-)]|uniref:Uncharacterized protein n=2 Tax=Phycomyces blakesleeanus TaxID=4837 RepID=A0A162TG57_PHYB8|nr:hypothetical protein PHYBLDRAFT_152137 [Phycomyces blakesleeanus NRRL 1555(-)]OAD66873.1 hypothetical protein PHYBLDRAFT_152137 [Phycomyces blakesleeanus NRRL 1555(-)]|eukprot:XP_018284913.1 hypothetical protein PHYBLDRAFT_152137 [Phycomyces blakesleeanus NRRL 1555(-)]
MSLVQFYGKIFGLGVGLGGAMELLLIKSNYYQMLAASEAKTIAKEMAKEEEDRLRVERMIKSETSSSSST